MEISTTTYSLTKSSTKDNEKYQMVPVPPGFLQYYVKKEFIINFDINSERLTNNNYKEGYELECHTKENLSRLTPYTSTGKKLNGKWKILLIIKKITGDKICLKGALINIENNDIALISSINKSVQEMYQHRMMKSFDDEYKICQCKMIAPLLFWDELKNRLLY